jgi:voltage-gated potassium channel
MMDRHDKASRRRPGRSFLEWQLDRFLRRPPTVRTAATVIVTATSIVVVLSAVLMRILDAKDFPSIWLALWWAIQTATTVGYGDVVPHHTAGYVVGAFVMLEGLAFLAIVTAGITSTFVARAQRALGMAQDAYWNALDTRLDRIEQALGIPSPPSESPPSHDAAPIGAELDPAQTRQRRDP